jgi:hypothetical protein
MEGGVKHPVELPEELVLPGGESIGRFGEFDQIAAALTESAREADGFAKGAGYG